MRGIFESHWGIIDLAPAVCHPVSASYRWRQVGVTVDGEVWDCRHSLFPSDQTRKWEHSSRGGVATKVSATISIQCCSDSLCEYNVVNEMTLLVSTNDTINVWRYTINICRGGAGGHPVDELVDPPLVPLLTFWCYLQCRCMTILTPPLFFSFCRCDVYLGIAVQFLFS